MKSGEAIESERHKIITFNPDDSGGGVQIKCEPIATSSSQNSKRHKNAVNTVLIRQGRFRATAINGAVSAHATVLFFFRLSCNILLQRTTAWIETAYRGSNSSTQDSREGQPTCFTSLNTHCGQPPY